MKKVKYVALAVFVTLGLIGGAYAYWTDQVVVSGTVATGNLDVVITLVNVNNWNRPGTIPWTSATSSISAGGKSAVFSINGLYPTEKINAQNIAITIENNSTIPVKLDEVALLTDGSAYVWEHLMCEVVLRIFDENGTQIVKKNSGNKNFATDITSAIEDLLENEVIYPGWKVRLGADDNPEGSIIIWLDGENAGNETINQTIDFTLTFDWIQWNAQ